MSRICAKSFGSRAETTIVARHSSIISKIRRCALDGRGGGRSGNRRTSSLRKSFVAICRWNGYPQFFTQMSSTYKGWVRQARSGCVGEVRQGLVMQHVDPESLHVGQLLLQLLVDYSHSLSVLGSNVYAWGMIQTTLLVVDEVRDL